MLSLSVGSYIVAGGSVVSHVNVSQAQVRDGGSYACLAVNRAGSVAHVARLNVYGETRETLF